MSRKQPDRYVVRSATTVIAFWAGAAVVTIVVGAAIVQDDWRLFSVLLAPSLLVTWIFWIALYRPAVHYDGARAVVTNIGRRHVLPWGHVTNLRQAIGLVFDLDNGKTVVASGAPAPRRTGIIAGAIDRRTRPTNDANHEAEILDAVRRSAAPSPDPIVSTWDTVPLVVGAVLVVAVVIQIVVGI